jgi:hypothetical protein
MTTTPSPTIEKENLANGIIRWQQNQREDLLILVATGLALRQAINQTYTTAKLFRGRTTSLSLHLLHPHMHGTVRCRCAMQGFPLFTHAVQKLGKGP